MVDLDCMTQSRPIGLLTGRAYQLFFSEYGERISSASAELEQSISPLAQQDLKARFHMLKGSSGFFGFDEIQRLAGELENIFAKQAPLAGADIASAKEKLETLRDFQSQIPQPQTGTEEPRG